MGQLVVRCGQWPRHRLLQLVKAGLTVAGQFVEWPVIEECKQLADFSVELPQAKKKSENGLKRHIPPIERLKSPQTFVE
jgi:hypothetical protein